MERPGPALIGSVVVHAAIIGAVVLVLMADGGRPRRQFVDAVPVSILSEDMVLAGPADAPSDEPASDAAAAPPAEAVEPPPPAPAPVPTPRPPERTVAPRPTPRPTPPRPAATPPPATKRETPRPREETLDLGKLAAERPNPSTNRGTRPPSGQQSSGTAPRAIGRASLQALGSQIRPGFSCTLPGVEELTIRVSVRLSTSGRLIGNPRLLPPRGGASYQPVSDAVIRAIYAAQPFTMPAGYEEQDIPFSFAASQYC